MKTTLSMVMSANGFVARENGDEDFLPHEGWTRMLEYAKAIRHRSAALCCERGIKRQEVTYTMAR